MDLSILIPSRNEMFLARTIQDLLENIEADTEIIAVMDGQWARPPIPQNERVNVIYVPEAIGQRAGTNLACRMAKGKYVMKVDAHCSFDKGFDRKMIEAFKIQGDDVMIVPIMKNLHAFNWKCYNCGWTKYQGPTPIENGKRVCPECKKEGKIRMEMVWKARRGTHSTSYKFDSEPHFQYFNEYLQTEKYKKDLESGFTETMSLQGSCFMCTRENYWKWDVCDEKSGSWGNQGIELACATWLSGGRVLCYHGTWYAHMFRTQGGDFGFPYEQRGRQVQKTKNYIKDKFWNKKHPTQIYPLNWLVKKFYPENGWTEDDLNKLK